MPDLIASVVSLTAYRDRDLLASTVVSVLADWLQPLALSMYRCVGDPTAPRLLRQAGERRGAPALPGDPPWTPPEALPAAAGWPAHQQALSSGRPVLGVASNDGTRALVNVFPLSVGPQCVGLIEVVNDAPLSVEQQRLVSGVLKIYRNQIGLLDYSERDTLTGLLNRKTFDEQFGKCLIEDAAHLVAASADDPPGGRAERRTSAAPVRHWLGLIDIDHFKRVNDQCGHLIGDEVLLLVAGILRSAFRHGDRLYRFGGEEFVVLLRADSRPHAVVAFERFRLQMEAFRFPQVGRVTASVGFTELRPVDTGTAAFERADRAVYHAKESGRNQVLCHESLIESGALEDSEKLGEIELF
jgi:diguanylate cyclase (GGDEF)-like protein